MHALCVHLRGLPEMNRPRVGPGPTWYNRGKYRQRVSKKLLHNMKKVGVDGMGAKLRQERRTFERRRET